MALQFQQPNIDPHARKREDRQNVMAAMAQIPSVVLQYKQFKRNSEIADLEHQLRAKSLEGQLKEIEGKYGTGAGAPTKTTYTPSEGPGSTLAVSPILDPNAGMETMALPETDEEKLVRLGTERYQLLGKNPESQEKAFTQLNQLRGQYLTQSGDFKTIRSAYGRIKATAANPSPAGDLSLIFNYMKMLDPNSVVRESEFQNAETAAPLLTRLGLDWNKLQGVWRGERMTPAMRSDFLGQSDALYGTSANNQKALVKEFRRIAKTSGLDPDLAIVDFMSGGEEDFLTSGGAAPEPGGATAGVPAVPAAAAPDAAPPGPAANVPSTQGPTVVNDQATYDSLPRGAVYVTADGRTMRKR